MAEMKNQKLLNKALNLLPDLIETKVDAVQTVELYKNDNSIVIEQAVDYRKRVLKKGKPGMPGFWKSSGWVSDFKSELQGSHPDAPVWLKLHFAENATELFVERWKKKLSGAGSVLLGSKSNSSMWMWFLPSCACQGDMRWYVMIEVLDISSKFDLVVEDAFCTAVSSAKDQELSAF